MSKSSDKKRRMFVDQLAFAQEDILAKRYVKPAAVNTAQELLQQEGLSEEALLGAKGVLLLNGLL
jgi:hypothetical protein